MDLNEIMKPVTAGRRVRVADDYVAVEEDAPVEASQRTADLSSDQDWLEENAAGIMEDTLMEISGAMAVGIAEGAKQVMAKMQEQGVVQDSIVQTFVHRVYDDVGLSLGDNLDDMVQQVGEISYTSPTWESRMQG